MLQVDKVKKVLASVLAGLYYGVIACSTCVFLQVLPQEDQFDWG